MPAWLHILSCAAITAGIASSLWLCLRLWRRPAPMAVMNLVWPLVALSGGPLAVWLRHRHGAHPHGNAPMPLAVAAATCHCGAGCTLGDLIAETLAFALPGLLAWFGLGSLFARPLFATWLLDFVLAYLLGIAFQYFSIAPMRGLAPGPGLRAALKADTLSLLAWQAGMYGVMAAVQLGWRHLSAGMPEFWFAMQIAMLAGFAVSYPVNWWLVETGIKERM